MVLGIVKLPPVVVMLPPIELLKEPDPAKTVPLKAMGPLFVREVVVAIPWLTAVDPPVPVMVSVLVLKETKGLVLKETP